MRIRRQNDKMNETEEFEKRKGRRIRRRKREGAMRRAKEKTLDTKPRDLTGGEKWSRVYREYSVSAVSPPPVLAQLR